MSTLTLQNLKVGGKYNWKGQPERLVYLGPCDPRKGRWHQFAKVEDPSKVWCGVSVSYFHMLEETVSTTPTPAEQPEQAVLEKAAEAAFFAQDFYQEQSAKAAVPQTWHDTAAGAHFEQAHGYGITPAPQAEESAAQDADAMPYEKYVAIREGHFNAASEEYFNARPQLDNNHNRRIFYAGHCKGYDAAIAANKDAK